MKIVEFNIDKSKVGLTLILLGIFFFFFATPLLGYITQIIAFFIFISGILKLFKLNKLSDPYKKIHLSNTLVSIILAGLIFYYPQSILVFLGWWLLVNSILNYISLKRYYNKSLFSYILPIGFGLFLILNPNLVLSTVMEVIGIFLIIQGIIVINLKKKGINF